jgi:hypothetical protein
MDIVIPTDWKKSTYCKQDVATKLGEVNPRAGHKGPEEK